MMDPQLEQRAAKIRLLLMDVDGVITNGLIYNVPGPKGVPGFFVSAQKSACFFRCY